MSKYIIFNANRAFESGNYKKAKYLYEKAKEKYNSNLFDVNLFLCDKFLGVNNIIENNKLTPLYLDAKYAKEAVVNKISPKFNELISIIIPSYNKEKWIERSVYSALSQQGVNIEVIVVDDGSIDQSVEKVLEISKKYKNIKLISLLRNFGCYYARNIGVLHAKGEYVTIVDSDDIVAPDYIVTQLSELKRNPKAVAIRSQQRRWSYDFLNAISDFKPGENSLLWKKSILETIGYYDTVRYSADAEFRLRIQRTFGTESIVVLPHELYFTRALNESLTTNSDSQVFELTANELKVSLSPQRKKYEENFTNWQKQNKFNVSGKKEGIYISFPLLKRSFDLGINSQNASPSLNQKCIGTIASFPPRKDSLKTVVNCILPQLDKLIVYLNNYNEVPEFLNHPKIQIFRSQEELGDIRDNGKFYSLPIDKESYVFTFDDDLFYPKDYVAKMIHYIEILGRQCIVGVHGVIFPKSKLTSLEQRTVFYFKKESQGCFVDLLGTGTTAWHSSTFEISLSDFKTKGICDIYFSYKAQEKKVPMFLIPREKDWLKEIKRFEESLYQEALREPGGFLDIYNKILFPLIKDDSVRLQMERNLSSGYSLKMLEAAGIGFYENDSIESSSTSSYVSFSIVINGWNCSSYVNKCLSSVANQNLGPYTYDIILVDDGSTDNTFDKLSSTLLFPKGKIIKIKNNTGPAYARHLGIGAISNPESVVVLLDMDDSLEPNALNLVANKYINNASCLMTIGNWIDQNDKINPQGFYSEEQINNQKTRDVELFNATHLRTFKRKLYDAIKDSDLQDEDGKWFEVCTDVALMYPLLDQCWANEVEFIKKPIYRYIRNHGDGTIARFGKPYKLEVLAELKKRSPKRKLNEILNY